MIKSLRFMLLTALTMLCGSTYAQDDPAENTKTWLASSGDALTTVYLGDDVTLTWVEGGGDFAPKYDNGNVYFYNGNRVTVAGTTAEVKIKKIVFTFAGDKYTMVTCNSSGRNESSTGIANDGDSKTSTWTGDANSVIFRASKQTGVRSIASVEVTYTGSAAPVAKAPKLAVTNVGNFAETYELDGTSTSVMYATVKNDGTATAENAKLTLYVNGAVNNTVDLGTLAIGASVTKNIPYNKTAIEAGTYPVYLSATADDAEEAKSDVKNVAFTKKAPEASFAVQASNVTVPYGAENYKVVATVTNTSTDVDAEGVQVMLQRNIQNLVDPQAIDLAAGASKQVTFTVPGPFNPGSTSVWVVVNAYNKTMAQTEIDVTFEEEPVVETKDMAVTDIQGSIDLAQSQNSLTVWMKNNGTQKITNAAVTLKAGNKVLGTGTVTAEAGADNAYSFIAVNTEGLEAGEIDVTATVDVEDDATPDDNTFTKKITVKAIPAPEAKLTITAEAVDVKLEDANITIVAKVKNISEVASEAMQVNLLNSLTVIGTKTLPALAAGEETTVTFTVANPFTTVGEKTLSVMTENSKFGCQVTVNVTETVVETIDINLTAIQGLNEINLKETNSVQVVFDNQSNAENLNASIKLTLDGKEVGTAAIVKNINFVSFTLPTEGLTAGQEVTLVATLTAAGNKEGNTEMLTRNLPVVSGDPTEVTLTVTTPNIETELADKTVKVVVNVKNSSEIKADQVEVKVLKGMQQLGESKYIFGLEGGAEQNVTIEFANFTQAGTYELQAFAGKFGTHFNVVVKNPVTDLAVDNISGNIDLSNATSNVTVTVKNNGTTDVTDAKVTLTAGDKELGTATIASIKAGKEGYAFVQVATEGLTAGELDVTAKVEAENDATPADNEKTVTLTVKAASAAEASFSVVAENVTVAHNATSFDIVAKVKNTSDVDAKDVEVRLLKGINAADVKTIAALAAGAEQSVTFTISEIDRTARKYYVQAGNAQAEVDVTYAEAPTTEVKNLAVESISGIIDLSATQSNVTVTVKNNGTVDVKDAKVTLTYGTTTLDKTLSVKAGEQGYAFFQVSSEGIEGTELAVTAKVELEGDATPADNEKTEILTVKAASAAEPTFSVVAENVTVAHDATTFDIVAKVKNTSDVDAKDVEVLLLKGINVADTKTIAALAAGAEQNVTFTISEIDRTARKYYVQVAGKAQAEVEVTYAEAPAEKNVDMALTQVQGTEINLKEENKVMVWYQNLGNVATTATVSAKLNGKALEAQTIENVKPEGTGHVDFVLPVEGLTAGEKAQFEATINAEGDANADNNTIAKELAIVSGETEPAAEISINPIRGWEVEAGEQQVNVTVSVFNNGDVDAENVTVDIYHKYPEVLATATFNKIEKGGGSAFKTVSFNFNFEQGRDYEFTAYTKFADANADDNMRTFTLTCPAPKAEVAIAKIADISATTADDVTVTAVLTNNSNVEAKDVKVGLYKIENLAYQLVGIQQIIESIAAGEQQQVDFKLGKLEAGNYDYYVRVVSVNGVTSSAMRDVTVKVTEAQDAKVDVALTQIQGISNIDLAEGAVNSITIWAQNSGNVDAQATINVKLNETALEAQTLNVKSGKYGFASFTLPTEGLVAGQKATLVATVAVEGNTSEATTLTREYDIVDSSQATEPVFTLTAEPVEVEEGTEKFDVVATVKNTSTIDAQNVEVKLFHNTVIATKTIEALAAGAEQTVTFADVENPFANAGTYTMYVIAPKAQAEVSVTVKAEQEAEKVDVALTQVQGISNIDLAEGAVNSITIWAQNNGNVDAQATISVKLNETALEAQTLSVKAGKYGFAAFTLPTEGLVAGQKATLVATVAVEGNTSEATTLTREYDVVDSSLATEPVFALTAQPVEVEEGTEKFDVVAKVKNTSNIDAQNVEVKLFHNTVIATKTIEALAAGAEQTVTFADVENPFANAGTYTMYVIAPKAQAEVSVTVKAEQEDNKVDLAIAEISGTLSLDVETNYVTVFVENKGNVDVADAAVTLSAGDVVLGKGTVSVKAGKTGFCSIAVEAEKLQAGEFTVVAKVDAEGDADQSNNTMSKTYTIDGPAPVLSFTVDNVEAIVNAESFAVNVTVSNEGRGAAQNVKVQVYSADSELLAEKTIAEIAAGGKALASMSVAKTYTELGTLKNELQIVVTGVEGAKWVDVDVVRTHLDAIDAVKAQIGAANAQVYTLDGKKVDSVQKAGTYILRANGKTIKFQVK